MIQATRLTQEDALKMVLAGIDKARLESKDIAIAVVDEHGELMAFLHTTHCNYASINIAMNKAFTAARDRKTTFELAKGCAEFGYQTTYFGDLRYTGFGGGVPVVFQNHVIGAVGVSGLTQEEDEVYAKYAISALDQ